MVQDITTIDQRYYNDLFKLKDWDDRIQFVCAQAINFESAMLYGKKIQRCSNNAYVLYQGGEFITYSDSMLVSGLLCIFSDIFSDQDEILIQTYQPKFLTLLVDSVPDQTILNIVKAFREA